MRVFVYFNLHKKCWSVKALEGPDKGRVIAHEDTVNLIRPKFKVSQAGRKRVLKERAKNVHAGVEGIWTRQSLFKVHSRCVEVTYNPYKYSSFVMSSNKYPIYTANFAMLSHGKVFVQ